MGGTHVMADKRSLEDGTYRRHLDDVDRAISAPARPKVIKWVAPMKLNSVRMLRHMGASVPWDSIGSLTRTSHQVSAVGPEGPAFVLLWPALFLRSICLVGAMPQR